MPKWISKGGNWVAVKDKEEVKITQEIVEETAKEEVVKEEVVAEVVAAPKPKRKPRAKKSK